MAVDAIFSYRVIDEARFQRYLDEVLPTTEQHEPYVLGYELFRSPEGVYYQHETYVDEAAIHQHMKLTASGQEDFAASTEMLSAVMLGEVSDEFREQYGIETQFLPFRSVQR
ncbi:hypothetical protein [Aeromicrobium sp. Leaf350]|uniref:hypothetical protein n=1 Tax=Aeromicrobium sp. Leaf350 TaxID=2876565 RepID=UPI001E4B1198|nr:hypothetical protein [Aeromicrobium sp. Leaf350]